MCVYDMYLGKKMSRDVCVLGCLATTTTGVNPPNSTCAFAIGQAAINAEVVSHHSSMLSKAHNGCMEPKVGQRGSGTYIIWRLISV